jgi:hypothetical protein
MVCSRVRIDRAQYRWHAQKPYYLLRFAVLKPKPLAGLVIIGQVDCSPKALWKLNWFLRAFGYDTELLRQDRTRLTPKIWSDSAVLSSQPHCSAWHFPTQT